MWDIDGTVFIIEGQFIIQAEGKGPAPVVVVHCNIVGISCGEGIDNHSGGSLSHDVPHTDHLVHGLIPHGDLSALHASVYTSGLDLDRGIRSGGHELEPDIVQFIAGTPAGSGYLVRSSLGIGEFGIGRASVIMGNLQGPDQVIVIHLVIQAEGEGPAPVIVVHSDPVPVTYRKCVSHQQGGTLVDDISHTGHLCTGFVEDGHLPSSHRSVDRTGL